MPRYYYSIDEQGSTDFITDGNQRVRNEYYYDVFGNVLEAQEDIHNRITYTGQQFDGIIGQYYLRVRYYNFILTILAEITMAYFLEYLFLIEDKELEQKFKEYKRKKGGVASMTVDQIRQKYYEQKGREEGRNEEKIQVAKNLLDVLDDETIAGNTDLDIEEVRKLRDISNNNIRQ